jgi:hypothetical protein
MDAPPVGTDNDLPGYPLLGALHVDRLTIYQGGCAL